MPGCRAASHLVFPEPASATHPTHLHPTLHTRLQSFDGNNGDQSVSFLSSRCPPLRPFILSRSSCTQQKKGKKNPQQQTITTVPSLSLTANYFWPTYPDRKRWHFFPPSFFFFIMLLVFILCSSCCPVFFILLCQKKGN